MPSQVCLPRHRREICRYSSHLRLPYSGRPQLERIVNQRCSRRLCYGRALLGMMNPKSYPSGQPELSILKITLAPHTELEWHSHPIPNAAYLVSGELTLERKEDGKKQHFAAGQAVSETVNTFHKGIAGNE